jgi:hypothetical protein
MDFEKKYPITQQPGDHVLAKWTRGYKQIELYYKDTLIAAVDGGSKLKKGIKVQTTPLGIIELKLSETPIMLNLIIDGFHSPVNTMHPEKVFKKSSMFFWMLVTGVVLLLFIDGASINFKNGSVTIEGYLNFIFLGIYIASAILVSKGKVWGFYMGFGAFALTSLFALLTVFFLGFMGFIALVLRAIIMYFIVSNFKNANGALKHRKYRTSTSVDLLDSAI